MCDGGQKLTQLDGKLLACVMRKDIFTALWVKVMQKGHGFMKQKQWDKHEHIKLE